MWNAATMGDHEVHNEFNTELIASGKSKPFSLATNLIRSIYPT
jgi:hypothetical protein